MFKTVQIQQFRDKLGKIEGVPIIVEGIKDERALAKLGFENIFGISGKTLDSVAEDIYSDGYKSVVILTDFDEEGKRKAHTLTKLFQINGIIVDQFIRNRIKDLFGIHKIEELSSFTKIMEDDYYGKACSVYDKIFDRSKVLNRRNSRKTRCHRSRIRSNRGFAWSRP